MKQGVIILPRTPMCKRRFIEFHKTEERGVVNKQYLAGKLLADLAFTESTGRIVVGPSKTIGTRKASLALWKRLEFKEEVARVLIKDFIKYGITYPADYSVTVVHYERSEPY